MIPDLSLNTQAILLLTAPLMVGANSSNGPVLSPKEYKFLAQKLHVLGQQPASFLGSDGAALVRACSTVIDASRLQELLSRGFLLSQAVEQWRARSIWVISRADPEYPSRLKNRMRSDAPPVLYGCGNLNLLETGGLAIVGPRKTQNSLIEYAKNAGQLAAQTGIPVVSGGANGIDDAAIHGVIEAGGYGCEVLAEELFSAVIDRERRSALMSQQLLLVSAYDPQSRFNVGHALQRNKLIYAMADAALVVDSDIGKGGTWAGAIEQIEKLRYVPVFVRSAENPSPGLSELMSRGACKWPEPPDSDSLHKLFENLSDYVARVHEPVPGSDSLFGDIDKFRSKTEVVSNGNGGNTGSGHLPTAPADILFQTMCNLLQEAGGDILLEDEVAKMLDVVPEQARRWLKRLEIDGVLAYDDGGNFRVVSAVKHSSVKTG